MRIELLRALVVAGALLVLITEAASVFHALTPTVVAACWFIFAAVLWRPTWRGVYAAAAPLVEPLLGSRKRPDESGRGSLKAAPRAEVIFGCATIAGILAIVGYTALISAPNSADAMSYHLPRVLMWVQNRSVEFFPTSYLNLIMLQPVAEYAMLHLYLLSGGDALTNLVQFTGFAGSVVAVSSLAAELGLSPRGQMLSAIVCVTLPNGILQASGAKNDCVLSLWLVCALLFGLRGELAMLGLASGLALGTKGTAYLFLPPILVVAALIRPVRRPNLSLKALAAVAAGTLLINGPQYWRNIDLSGSTLGFDSSHADGAFRWRNEHLGWKPTVSNALRNLSEQLGARSEEWNRSVFTAVVNVHNMLGIDPQDPGTTWRWSEYRPPRNSNHEADANNRYHLMLFIIGAAVGVFRRDRRWVMFALAPVCGLVLFSFYLKWQPFFSRLLLPLFVITAPLGAMALQRLRPMLQIITCVLLISNIRLALTENWTRPLLGPNSIRSAPRETQYFNDMVQWNNRASYLIAVDRVAQRQCRLVGLDNLINHVGYPFQTLLLARRPDTRFVYVGVENPSLRYAKNETPCAVLCIDCADSPERIQKLSRYGTPETFGRFVLISSGETPQHPPHSPAAIHPE